MPQTKKSEAQAMLSEYLERVTARLGPEAGIVLSSAWLRANSLARRVYGLSRKLAGSELAQAAAQAGAGAVGKGLTAQQAIDTVHISLEERGCGFAREQVEELMGPAALSGCPATPPPQVKGKPKIRVTGTKNAVPRRTALSITEVEKETPLEMFTRQRATQQLRFALAPHQPVVKRCVALRLSKHKSYKALAEELGLSTEQVEDILTRMRGWVSGYTTYFDHDWYWKEGAVDLPGEKRGVTE